MENEFLSKVQVDREVEAFRKALDDLVDAAAEQLREQISDEYYFQDLINHKAKELLIEMLNGNDLAKYGLETRKFFSNLTRYEECAFDYFGVRRALIKDFGDKIVNAEIIELNKRIKGLTEENKELRTK